MRRIHVTILCGTLGALTALTALTLPWPARAAASPQRQSSVTYATIRVAYTGTDGNVYLMDANGTHRTQITQNANQKTMYPWYAWSPDHKYLLLLRQSTTPSYSYKDDILVLNQDGSLRSTVVTGIQSGSFYPTWASDSDVIAYIASSTLVDKKSYTTLYTVNRVDVNGTKARAWTYPVVLGCGSGGVGPPKPAVALYQAERPGFVIYSLRWSIAAHYAIYDTECTGFGVKLTDLKTNKTRSFPDSITQVVQAPSAALYAVADNNGVQVYKDSGGAAVLRLVGAFPAWSPDSHFLYFVQYRKNLQCTIFKAEIRTRDVSQMIPWQQNVYSFGPLHVTANGQALVFSRIDVLDSKHARISVQRLDSAGLTTLARDAARPAL